MTHSVHAIAPQWIETYFKTHADLQDAVICHSPTQAIDQLEKTYDHQTACLHDAIFSPEHVTPMLLSHQGTYPYLGLYAETVANHTLDAYGHCVKPGFYGTTITRPDFFREYLIEQLSAIHQTHGAIFVVGQSRRSIPLSFVRGNPMTQIKDFSGLRPLLSMPCLRDIDDKIVNGLVDWEKLPIKPLFFFPAERVDYSLGRLKHYCGTLPEHFQNFVLMTNYQRYIDGFFAYAKSLDPETCGYTHWVEPQDHAIPLSDLKETYPREKGSGFQMPAYHLKRPDKNGITLINIGVGPSNTKTITDHLAVLRSHCWMMIGHCGGLHHTLRLGDYVLANSYVRDDHVLNEDLPLHIPIPPIAEIQQAIIKAAESFLEPQDIRRCLRSGAVASTGNRNWELRVEEIFRFLNLSKALAVDMESATLAANAFRFSIPYGVLLCVSDRPLHGELKLFDQAQSFYQKQVEQHLLMGIKTMEILRDSRLSSIHSRKLRGFQAIPFR